MTQEQNIPSFEVDPEESFRVYIELLSDVNTHHPQHQGMIKEEFEHALQDPLVYKTRLEHAGTVIDLPQLAPVSTFEWLNTPVYDAKFPEATARGEIFQYTDLPGIEPGENIKERLSQLIANHGVIVFDFPDNDPEYPERISNLLKELGAENFEAEQLAVQTYFAGHVRLKRKEVGSHEPVGVLETFEAAVEDGIFDPVEMAQNGPMILRTVDDEQAEHMREFYDRAYTTLNAEEFCNQGMPADEFFEMMTDQPEVVKVVNSVDGEIISLMLLDNDLTKLSWVNADYYKAKYPEKYAKGQVMWFPGLAADPDKDVGGNTQTMVNHVTGLLERGNNEIVVVFDCGNINTGFLDVFLNIMINKTQEVGIDIEPIARQKYMAVEF